MMVETILESSQDFGMSVGSLPQWKRELLQRRAARHRPPPAQPPPPPPAAPEEDEELRYGPGIVKRLKSRYLSLALRDAPRRRPSVLRRATSLEHLLDEPPAPPAPSARPPRPMSLAVPPPPPHRRDLVKRARSVDALSRLEAREDPAPPPTPPRMPPPPRMPRPPRRPPPLLRDAERPPPDLVRSTLRKFEPTAQRRPQPAARVSAALKALDSRPLTSTPEPRVRSPSPGLADLSAIDEGAAAGPSIRPVSRAALEGIAKAGSTTRYSFEAARRGSHLPPLAATNPVLVGRARRVGVIRPMPSPQLDRADPTLETTPADHIDKPVEVSSPRTELPPPSPSRIEERTPSPARMASPMEDVPPSTPPPPVPSEPDSDRREPPSAMVEPIPRPSPDAAVRTPSPETIPPAKIEAPVEIDVPKSVAEAKQKILAKPDVPSKPEPAPRPDISVKVDPVVKPEPAVRSSPPLAAVRASPPAAQAPCEAGQPAWGRSGGRVPRGPPVATSVVFNFAGRAHVPDYIENDGIILRSSRRDRIKPGEPGVVVLIPELALAAADSDEDEADCGPPSPCQVKFVNDNVLINGRSSMPARPDKTRHARLKLQFDDSLTRTFEYPSETSLCEFGAGEPSPASPSASPVSPSASPASPGGHAGSPPPPQHNGHTPSSHLQSAHRSQLLANTHMASSSLSRYTPSKTCAAEFQLGVTRTQHAAGQADPEAAGLQDSGDAGEHTQENGTTNGDCSESEGADAAAAGPWWRSAASSDQTTDLLF